MVHRLLHSDGLAQYGEDWLRAIFYEAVVSLNSRIPVKIPDAILFDPGTVSPIYVLKILFK